MPTYLNEKVINHKPENLGKAIEIFKECVADGWVDKYEKKMAGL